MVTMGTFYNNDIDIRSLSNVLKQMSNEELEAILNDTSNVRVDSLIKDLPQVKSLENERERLIENNKKIAESNLSFESTYCLSREELINALSECQTMKDDLEKKKSKLRELSRQNSMDTTLALMQAAMAEAEEASDEVANQFLSKETSIEEFLKSFIEKRKLFHSRRIKSEKMPEEMSRMNSSMIQPTRPAPKPPAPTLPFSQMTVGQDNNPPYPTTATNPFAPPYMPYQPNHYNYN